MLLDQLLYDCLIDGYVLYLLKSCIDAVHLVFEDLSLCLFSQVRVLRKAILRNHLLVHVVVHRVRKLSIKPDTFINSSYSKSFPFWQLERRWIHFAVEQFFQSLLILLRQVITIPVNLSSRFNHVSLKQPVRLLFHHINLHNFDIIIILFIVIQLYHLDLRLVHFLQPADILPGDSAFQDFRQE